MYLELNIAFIFCTLFCLYFRWVALVCYGLYCINYKLVFAWLNSNYMHYFQWLWMDESSNGEVTLGAPMIFHSLILCVHFHKFIFYFDFEVLFVLFVSCVWYFNFYLNEMERTNHLGVRYFEHAITFEQNGQLLFAYFLFCFWLFLFLIFFNYL